MVDTHVPLLHVAGGVAGGEVVSARALPDSGQRLVFLRVLVDQRRGDAVEPLARDPVVREWVANYRALDFALSIAVEYLPPVDVSAKRVGSQDVAHYKHVREIAVGHARARHSEGAGETPVADDRALVVGEPEGPVLGDRTSHGRSELVLLECLPRVLVAIVLPSVGIRLVVLQELENRAVDIVGARLDRDVHDSASGASVLGVVSVGQDLHLADRFDRGAHDVGGLIDEVDDVDVVVDAVQQEVVLPVRANPVGRESAARSVASAGLRRHDRRNRPGQEGEPSLAAERQLAGLAVLERSAHLRGLCLQGGRGCQNLDRFSDLADFQDEVRLDSSRGLQNHAVLHGALEARRLARDCVYARLDERTDEVADRVRLDHVGDARRLFRDGDRRARNRGAGRIRDAAEQCAHVSLGESDSRPGDSKDESQS